ncbi:hypothetical protein GQ473_04450 [archaeon]|nr:hypothetical protein [archaeon]
MIFDVWLSLKKGQEIELLLKTSLRPRVVLRKLVKKDHMGHQRTYELDDGTKIDIKIGDLITKKSKIRIENDDEICVDVIKGELGINL